MRYDGEKVTRDPFVTSANLRGVWGTASRVFAVGDNGTILEYDGDSWSIVPHVTSRRLRAVGSSGGSAAFAVGDHGAVLRYDGSGWSVDDTPTTMNLFGVWVQASDNVFAVGSFGTILHYDGEEWRVMETPTTLNLTAVWGTSATQVFAVGDHGTILEFDGSVWRRVDNVTTLNLRGINNGFIVGQFGTVLYNPNTLVPIPLSLSAESALQENDAVLTWDVFGGEVEQFDIFRRVDDGPEVHYAGPVANSVRRFDDPGLDHDHTYAYVVAATRTDGTVTRSGATQVHVAAEPAVVFSDMRTVTTPQSVLLLWQPEILERIDGYRIYRRASNSSEDVDITGGFLLPPDATYFMDEVETIGHTHYYSIAAVKPNGTETRVAWSPVSVAAPRIQITNIYPNPFAAQTTISINLPTAASIDAAVYDVRGKRVAVLPTQSGVAGRNVVTWNGRDNNGRRVSTGTYFVKVQSSGAEMTRKLVIVR